jgi:GNAT superfamily N-acetyltransferase
MTEKHEKISDTQFINEILHLDSLVYQERYQGTFDEVYDRYKANRDMFILLYSDKKLIGYLCLFPIKDQLYERIRKEDRVFDSDIPADMLEPYVPGGIYKLYLISAVIHPEYQKQGLSKLLVKGFHQFINDKKNDNITFSSALSTSITEGGKRILEKLGFTEIKRLGGSRALHELFFTETRSNEKGDNNEQ